MIRIEPEVYAPEAIVTVTGRALREIREIISRERPEEGAGLRLGVTGGGCSGLSYRMELSQRQDNDEVVDVGGVTVLLDPKSAIYLKGITVDYQDGLTGRGFVFHNPNASNTCGCGDSFAV
jgi:iron-sulfur cluster assembly protein